MVREEFIFLTHQGKWRHRWALMIREIVMGVKVKSPVKWTPRMVVWSSSHSSLWSRLWRQDILKSTINSFVCQHLQADGCPGTRPWANPPPRCMMSRLCHWWGWLLWCPQQAWLGCLSWIWQRSLDWSCECSHGFLHHDIFPFTTSGCVYSYWRVSLLEKHKYCIFIGSRSFSQASGIFLLPIGFPADCIFCWNIYKFFWSLSIACHFHLLYICMYMNDYTLLPGDQKTWDPGMEEKQVALLLPNHYSNLTFFLVLDTAHFPKLVRNARLSQYVIIYIHIG